MPERSYKDSLTTEEREEFEGGLISFCDFQLDMLGDIRGLDVLYAGGTSLLWIEGLSQRVGKNGSITVLDLDEEALDETRKRLSEAGLAAPVNLVAGNVFSPPFEYETFDLAYSAALFHELDVTERTAEEALKALSRTVRHGRRLATTDFVDSVPAAQIEDENLQKVLKNKSSGQQLYGIGPPERLVTLHKNVLEDVKGRILEPASYKTLREDSPVRGRAGRTTLTLTRSAR